MIKLKIKRAFNKANEVLELTSKNMNVNKFKKMVHKYQQEFFQSRKGLSPKEIISALNDYKYTLLRYEEEGKRGKLFCWHSWVYICDVIPFGEKFQCKKCQKTKYND